MKAWLNGDRAAQERHFQTLLEMKREYQALRIAKWSALLIPAWFGLRHFAFGPIR